MNRAAGSVIGGILIGGVLGVGVGYVVFGHPRPQELQSTITAAASPAPSIAPDESLAAARTEATPPTVTSATDQTSAALRTAISTLRSADSVSTSGAISGIVKDPKGNPVAGVTIEARRASAPSYSDTRQGHGPPNRAPLEDRLRKIVESTVRDDSVRRQTTTDGDGRYVLDGISDGDFMLIAMAEGYELQNPRGPWDRVQAGSTVDFVATPLAKVPVAVLAPDGSTATEAWIDFRLKARSSPSMSGGPGRQHWTSDEPVLWVKPGRYDMQAMNTEPWDQGPRRDELASDTQTVKLGLDAPSESLRFQLHARVGVRGRVNFPTDEDIDNVTLRITQVAPGQTPDFSKAGASATSSWINRSSPRYAFRDLAQGTYAIGVARGWDQAASAVATVEVRDAMVDQDVDIPSLDIAQCLVVWVYGTHGEVISDASFEMRVQSPRNTRSNSAPSVRKSNGSACILPPNDLASIWKSAWDASTHLFLAVTSDECGKKEIELQPGQREATIRFADAATLDVSLSGYRGSGFEGLLSVELRRPSSGVDPRFAYGGSNDKVFDADGNVTLGPAETGDYEIILKANSRAKTAWSQTIPVNVTSVTLQGGTNAITLPLPSLYPLTVRVPDGKAGESLQLQSSAKGSRRAWLHRELDENGKAQFENLPAGDYRIDRTGAGMPEIMRVRLPGPSEVSFEAEPQNALVVSITDRNGTLATAGFQDGDVIVAIDGKEFSTLIEAFGAMTASMAKKEALFRVERGRSSVDIKLDPSVLMKQNELGGEIEPGTR
ncbi:MAG: hypothetical protein HYR85_05735 [Planctomycetes bacterium]|nr:hypothetical protein [Planctomycetota bacterium]MBI3843649.1 hypothetical protein [Planctomycetota bacterium]